MMDSTFFNTNERKTVTFLLSQLEKKIYLLRISLYGSIEEYCPKNASFSKEILNIIETDDLENFHKLPMKDFHLMVDCCDIEKILQTLQYDLQHKENFDVLAAVIGKLKSESNAFKKHKRMIEAKQMQIDEHKQKLSGMQSGFKAGYSNSKAENEWKDNTSTKATPFDELAFLHKLLAFKRKSQRSYYDHKIGEIQENIEWYEREARTQAQADILMTNFWLLKFDDYTRNLDMSLREMFDSWSSQHRNLQILKKYRRLNQEKTLKLQKLIEERENFIKNYEKEKEIEEDKRKEELKIFSAAVLIQAVWKGTMVRKHLGPFQVNASKKKGKGIKGKGKKGKGKKRK